MWEWPATIAIYCTSRMVEHHKSMSTQPIYQSVVSPCKYPCSFSMIPSYHIPFHLLSLCPPNSLQIWPPPISLTISTLANSQIDGEAAKRQDCRPCMFSWRPPAQSLSPQFGTASHSHTSSSSEEAAIFFIAPGKWAIDSSSVCHNPLPRGRGAATHRSPELGSFGTLTRYVGVRCG